MLWNRVEPPAALRAACRPEAGVPSRSALVFDRGFAVVVGAGAGGCQPADVWSWEIFQPSVVRSKSRVKSPVGASFSRSRL